MLQPRSIQSSLSLRDKIFSIDYILVLAILVLGITSMFAMYSTDGGEWYLNSPPSVEYIANMLTIPKINMEKTKM